MSTWPACASLVIFRPFKTQFSVDEINLTYAVCNQTNKPFTENGSKTPSAAEGEALAFEKPLSIDALHRRLVERPTILILCDSESSVPSQLQTMT